MVPLKLNRKMFDSAGMLFILLFTLVFTATNLVMIDFMSLQSIVRGQDGFIVLILIAIFAYLYRNSTIQNPSSKIKTIFLTLWCLYIISMFISMVAADHFVFSEALILVLITALFLYEMKKELVVYIILAAILSTLSLLLSEITLNESGATLVLIYAAGFLLLPKRNRWVVIYTLPALLLLLTITTSRTAILTFLFVLIIHLAYINLVQTPKRQKQVFIGMVTAALLGTLIFFFRPLYHFFTLGSVGRDGVDWNALTSTRYELWATVFHNSEWFGEGHRYFDFTDLLHAHNIFFDTLGRYGIMTAVLFAAILIFAFVMAAWLIKTFSSAVFIFAFVIIGMFEYNWLFMFTYFSPIILFLVITSYILSMERKMKHY